MISDAAGAHLHVLHEERLDRALLREDGHVLRAARDLARGGGGGGAAHGGGREEGQRRTSMSWALAALFWRPVIVRVRPADGSAG